MIAPRHEDMPECGSTEQGFTMRIVTPTLEPGNIPGVNSPHDRLCVDPWNPVCVAGAGENMGLGVQQQVHGVCRAYCAGGSNPPVS